MPIRKKRYHLLFDHLPYIDWEFPMDEEEVNFEHGRITVAHAIDYLTSKKSGAGDLSDRPKCCSGVLIEFVNSSALFMSKEQRLEMLRLLPALVDSRDPLNERYRAEHMIFRICGQLASKVAKQHADGLRRASTLPALAHALGDCQQHLPAHTVEYAWTAIERFSSGRLKFLGNDLATVCDHLSGSYKKPELSHLFDSQIEILTEALLIGANGGFQDCTRDRQRYQYSSFNFGDTPGVPHGLKSAAENLLEGRDADVSR